MRNIPSLIRLNELFQGLSEDIIQSQFSQADSYVSEYKKNSIIHFDGETCNVLDIILTGTVVIQRIDEDGNVLTISEFNSGDIIGGNLLFSRRPIYPMTITSKTDTTILHVNKDIILNLCQSDRKFLMRFLICISDKTSILTNKIKTISSKSIRESVIDYLRYESHLQGKNRIQLSMTKKELAERLGVQRTSLSRELSKMKKNGLIDFDAKTITVMIFPL